MSVSSTNNVVILNADGSTHSFTFNFKIFAASDLKVIVRSSAGVETDQTLNSQYIIPDSSVDNASGGNILFKFNTGTSSDAHFSSTDFRPANGSKVILRQNIPLTQTLDLVNNDPFDAETLESSLDRIVLQVQSVKEAVDRSFKFSRSNLLDSSGSQIGSTYPEIEEDTTARANKLLSFDSTGTPIATQEVGTAKGDWAASTAYQERDIVRDTSTNNLFIVNTAHTSSGSEPLTSNANSSKYTIILNNGAYTNITASGVITGSTIEPTGDTSSGDNAAIGHTSDEGLILTGQGAVSDITFKNDVDVTVFTIPTGTDDILFPDNAKILIGSGSDLRIYHESDNSYIDERGSGRLYILSDTQVEIGNAGNATNARFNSGGSSILHYNNSNKFETSDTGATLTGALTVSSHVVTSEIQLTSGAQPDVRFESTLGGDRFDLGIDAPSIFRLRNYNDSRDDLKFDGSGVATFGGAVNITGALTVIGGIADSNLNTITTADKVSGAAIQIDGATDGTSITIVDADKLLIDDNGTTKYINASQLNSYISAAASAVAADNITAGDAAVTITTTSGNITIDAQANDSNIVFKGTDGSVDTTFLTISGADAGQATFNGKIVADAGIDVDDFNIDGTAITLSAGNFSLNADSNILLNTHYDGSTSGGIIALKENNTNFGQLRNNSGELQIKSGASDTTALTFSGADATFSGTINTTSTNKLQFGDSGTYIHQSADGVLDLVSDTEIEINATTIDVNGNLDVSGSATIGSDVTSASGNFVTTGSDIALKHSSGENFFTATKDGASFIYHDAYGILGTVATNAVAIGTTNGNTFTLDTQSTFLEIGNSGIGGGTDAGTVVLSATSNANDERIGDIRFANVANADDDGTDADGKMVARIQSKSVTSDSNAGDDSGGTIVFSTKPEAGSIAAALTLGSDQSATFGGAITVQNATPTLKFTDTDNNYDATIQGLSGSLVLTADSGAEFGTETIQFKTGGSQNMTLDASGNLGIGTTTPSTNFNTNRNNLVISDASAAGITLNSTDTAGSSIISMTDGTGTLAGEIHYVHDTNYMMFKTVDTEAMRINNNQNLLIGHTDDISIDGGNQALQLTGTTSNDSLSIARFNADFGPYINFGRSGSGTIGTMTAVPINDEVGRIQWAIADGTDMNSIGASISAFTEQLAASNDVPCRLVFSTTADGASSPTERMRIDSSGNVGIGTTSPARSPLHLNVSSGDATIHMTNSSTGTSSSDGLSVFAGASLAGLWYRESGSLQFATNSTERMRIDSSGNIGIGTTTTAITEGTGMRIQRTGTATLRLQLFDSDNSTFHGFEIRARSDQAEFNSQNNKPITFNSSGSEDVRIDSSGNVGIGTSSNLLSGTNRTTVSINNSDSAAVAFGVGGTNEAFIFSDVSALEISSRTNPMRFSTGDAERMRIDASGNLLVGKTSQSSTSDGCELRNGQSGITASFTADASNTSEVISITHNSTSQPTKHIIIKDHNGNTKGTIGVSTETNSTGMFIGFGDTGLSFQAEANDAITPCSSNNGVTRDNLVDLGSTGGRFDDIHATNGTIQTSDENEKQDIASMTTAELAVGKRLSTLFKTFRWKDKVVEKADKARTHSGIIAQEVKAAFEAEGLDATKYALFCSDTWTNDDGKEQTRMGVRYPELLSFIASYNESRFTAIEARLTALEGG